MAFIFNRRALLKNSAAWALAVPALRGVGSGEALLGKAGSGDALADDLAVNFQSPPDSAKPWAYWWWLNGNVRKEGITKDLEEMKRQGINGVLIFQAGGGETPPGVLFLSPQWHELFRFALAEARRLGMAVSVNLCDGWDSGGPWITPDLANKKLVYSEFQVDGAGKISDLLPRPEVVDDYYHDVAVVAIGEKAGRPITPAKVTASSTLEGYVGEWNFPPQAVVDADPEVYWSAEKVASTPSLPQWLAFEYHQTLAATGLYVSPGPGSGPRECVLESSPDGKTFLPILSFSLEKGEAKRVDFPVVRATSFRLSILSAYGTPVEVGKAVLLRKGDELHLRPGIKWWMFKSANRSFWDYPRQGPAALAEEYQDDVAPDCRSNEVIDLTSSMQADGRMAWDVPPGRWTILRFGYTLEGQTIRAASSGGDRGYEANMLDRAAIETQFKNIAEPILVDAAAVAPGTLKTFHIDSYELGANVRGQQPTWSRNFREEFKARRGYDLLSHLPALAGRIVDSREDTDGFLFDFRWTVGDLMAEQFWIPFGELAHQHGVSVQGETGYGTYPYPHIDGLRCAGSMDIPMGEFWFGTDIMSQFNPWGNVIRSVASAAHIYGRPIVQAESFTAWTHWKEYPAALKPVGDEAFINGLNRMVFHQYTHQPLLDMKPGWQYGAGTHFDRNITWWEQARAFFAYLARCQYLLQQGRFVADALYFYGEGTTRFVPSKEYLRPALPQGYNFDAINAEQLQRLSIVDGRLALPCGMSYRALVLPEDAVLSPQALRKIRELVTDGGLVVGPRPQKPPGLKGYPLAASEVRTLAQEIWANCDGVNVKENAFGKGQVYWGEPLGNVLIKRGIVPDFEYRAGEGAVSLDFLHRSANGAEFYFVTNRQDHPAQAECVFRVAGKLPELWDPVSGKGRPAAAFKQVGGRISLPLDLPPYGSLFVVFRQAIGPDVNGTASTNFPVYSDTLKLDGPWTVRFDPQWGGPAKAEFADLTSWTMRPEAGIQYYSGTATYQKSFDLPASLRGTPARLALDLGEVRYVAQVRLNGRDLGPLWTEPFRVEITPVVKPAGNVLEIDVVNLWCNRVMGDALLPPDQRFTRTNITYRKDEPLMESGLLGPVKLQLIVDPGRR
jgi:hypothetical protein